MNNNIYPPMPPLLPSRMIGQSTLRAAAGDFFDRKEVAFALNGIDLDILNCSGGVGYIAYFPLSPAPLFLVFL